MICQICHSKFEDVYEHAFENGAIKQDHSIRWHNGEPCPICNGDVTTTNHPPDGWETTCNLCGLLLDED
jgi:hypothetical protein